MKYSNWVLRDRPSNRVFKLVNRGKYYQRYWLNNVGSFSDMGGAEWFDFEIDLLIKDGTWRVDKDHYLNQFADAVSGS